MKRTVFVALTLSLVPCWSLVVFAGKPAENVRPSVADEPVSLPKYMTAEEKLIQFEKPTRADYEGRTPPAGSVYCPPEYAYNKGLLFAWEGYTSVLTSLIVDMTTLDPEAIAYVFVDTASEQTTVTSTLTSAGADMDQVEFIIKTTNTVWIRDYGPRFIFEDNQRAIIDHTYNRPRPYDNEVPHHIAVLWDEQDYLIPLTHGGGNFHLFSNGDAFMSNLILSENPGLSEQDVKDLYSDYQNLDLTIYPGFPTYFDSTRHIDMWMMPVADDTIIIGEYEPSTGLPYTITRDAVLDLTDRGYTVYRTPGWNSGGTHYTYTNAVIINDLIFVPQFGGSYIPQDAEAMVVFQTALPDHTAIGVDCSSIIHAAGAIHCVVTHVPGYTDGMQVSPESDLLSEGDAGGPFTPDSIVYTVENLTGGAIDYEVTNLEEWVTVTNGVGTIPALDSVEVTVSINSAADAFGNGVYEDTVTFTNTTDHSGDTTRSVILTVGVPELVHDFPLDLSPGWSVQGQWAFGQPTGGGGSSYGYPDPSDGATGVNVYGVNLSGDYSTTPGGPYYLTTGAIDCTDLSDVSLHFWRWLNTDFQPYAYATLDVSNNGTTWTSLWRNGGSEIAENSWSEQIFDISTYADDQPAVYIRWGYQIGDDARPYSGWNVDDIEIWGLVPSEPPCLPDHTGDGIVNPADIQSVIAHFYPTCIHDGDSWNDPACAEFDHNGDNVIGPADIQSVIASFGPC